MNIARLKEKVNNKSRIKGLIYATTHDSLRKFLLSYGYLLNKENIREILLSSGREVITDVMLAYVTDDILDGLHIPTILHTPQLARRLSRKQIGSYRPINNIRAASHYTSKELCAVIKNYPPSLKYDWIVPAIGARRLYKYIIKEDCSLEIAPYVFNYIVPYASAPQIRRLINHFWKPYRKIMESARTYKVTYEIAGNHEVRQIFSSLLPHMSVVSWQYAVRFAHIMLTGMDHSTRCIIKQFPLDVGQLLNFLPHHQLMYMLLSWAANIDEFVHKIWPNNPTAVSLRNCVAAMMRRGRLCARMPAALRFKVGTAFPAIIDRKIFTRAEIAKLKVAKGIGRVGCD